MAFFCENCHKLLPATANSEETLCMDCKSLRSHIEKIKRSSAKPRIKKDSMPHNALFPFDSPRKGQEELMKNIYDTMDEGKALVVHAPTGIGKTVSVLTPGLRYAIKNGKKIFFLTSRHTQHRIAIDTLRAIKERHDVNFSVIDIISKHRMCPREHEFRNLSYNLFNEMCNIEIKRRTCKYYVKKNKKAHEELGSKILHAEELVDLCKSKGLCPYKLAMELGAEANVIICDYNYIFSDINETILPKLGVELEDIVVIVDEAHNLPERIRAHLTYELTMYKLASIIKGLKAKDKFLGRLMADISAMLEKERPEVPNGQVMLIP
jgi:DNA excision repair protein ERCC-2